MGSSQQFSLRWNNYLKHITCAFDTLRTDEDLVDVTLSCEGKRIRAHKMLLSACSTYFRDLFKENPCQHPVIIFRNVKFDDLAALVDFMYQGEVNVVQEQLASFLTTAELLAVQGLTDGTGKDSDSIVEDDVEIPNEPEVQLQNASGKLMTNSKGSKSPSSPSPYHSVDLQAETPPTKRRKCRDNRGSNADKSHRDSNANSSKDSDNKSSENQANTSGSDPVEIIPLMPNLKLEMPEYLEQDGSSCSYEEQSIGESSTNKLAGDETTSNTPDLEQKPDISQTFYSPNQSDLLDGKRAAADLGNLLAKPSTSGERLAQDAAQEPKYDSPVGDPLLLTTRVEARRRSRPLHDESGRWVCDVCGKTYNRGDSLAHHRSIHRGDTICPICQAVFTRKYTMRCHMSIRTRRTLRTVDYVHEFCTAINVALRSQLSTRWRGTSPRSTNRRRTTRPIAIYVNDSSKPNGAERRTTVDITELEDSFKRFLGLFDFSHIYDTPLQTLILKRKIKKKKKKSKIVHFSTVSKSYIYFLSIIRIIIVLQQFGPYIDKISKNNNNQNL